MTWKNDVFSAKLHSKRFVHRVVRRTKRRICSLAQNKACLIRHVEIAKQRTNK